MRNAETVLSVIHERGKQGLPLERVYRLLFNQDLYLRAYGRVYRNDGAMTRGVTPETVDGMSMAKIQAIIDALRHERYRWTPVRRSYIPKRNGKTRPLGIPTWSDKLLQEVIRSILEAYYEPQFSSHSHGFRRGRGCHTALREIDYTWRGTTWFVEGDIASCFDSIDHEVLLSILGEKIYDNRFLRLLKNLLAAGYLESWRYNATLSGTPQGGIVSPILSNVYLDRLDAFVETTLLPTYNRGLARKHNLTYQRIQMQSRRAKRAGRTAEARTLRLQLRHLPSVDPFDPDYRRLRYVRYADDFLLGFAGPNCEAEDIKRQLREFLRTQLKLELSEPKTLITHARTGAARFLGYEIGVLQYDERRARTNGRRINGKACLRVPADVVTTTCARYQRYAKPWHRPERLHDSDFSIIAAYQAEFRGVVQYYLMAVNVSRLHRLRWVMELSLAKTLANKHRSSVNKVFRKYGARVDSPIGSYPVLQAVIPRDEGKAPLVARFGLPLRRQAVTVLNDHPPIVWNQRVELVERLLADTCELCGSQVDVEVHHIRRLSNLRRIGRVERPDWVKLMAARQRKTLVVCRSCHHGIHTGQPLAKQAQDQEHRRAG